MNVVHREKLTKYQSKLKNELLRRDLTNDIRGKSLPVLSYRTSVTRASNKTPRYLFDINDNCTSSSNNNFMGPPVTLPRSLKRKIIHSTSSKVESSSSSRAPRILASDSAAVDTSLGFTTPKNRPSALRYISSSSRGGHSGTRSARSTSTIQNEASVVLAISEGRGMARGEIGMAAVDLRHPHLVLCQFSDTLLYSHTLSKINYFNPIEIIVPHTFCEGIQPTQMYQLIKDQFPRVNVTTVQRRHFNDAAGRQNIQTLCAPQYSAVYLQVLQKFYALTAAAAVLKYVEYIQCVVFARESLKIEYHSSEGTMIIDVGTATQLELVAPLVPSAGPSCCLLGVLGPMYTVGGIRALRASILQPSSNKEFIENRLDAVQDLIENDSGLMSALQDVIKKLSDIDKILFLCMESTTQNIDKQGEAQLNQVLLLKTTMDLVPSLAEALGSAQSGRLRKIKMDFENPHYTEITEQIRKIIQDDAHPERGAMGSLQRCFAVKPNINGLLDVARRTYSELIDDIQKIVEQLGETYDLPFRVNQNAMKGFHIVLPLAPKNRRNFNVDDLPPIFIQVQYLGASVTMSTEELVVLDHQAKESLKEIQKMSNIVLGSLLKELRPFMSSLYTLCEDVAEIDILLALAQASSIGSYIRPEFNDYMEIRNSVHPLLDYNSQVMPIPNDIFASPEYNFTLITGPNMGGKSIYIKQVALMQVMAQLGCFVPATNAVFRISDRIFSRIGFNDSVELNASTFVFEIKEMQHILKCLTKRSLVIVDELCRATNEDEGTSIAWAICEQLINSEAFTFFTTHFMYLRRLQDVYLNVVNRHAVVTEEEVENSQVLQKNLIYTHKIEPGFTQVKNYGLALAAKTNLPADTVKLAVELADLLNDNETPRLVMTPEQNDEATLYKLNAELKLTLRKCNDEDVLKQMIQKFRTDNPLLIKRLKVQRSTTNDKTMSSDSLTNNVVVSKEHHTPVLRTNRVIENGTTDTDKEKTDKSSIIEPSPELNLTHKTQKQTIKYSTELLNSKVNFTYCTEPNDKTDSLNNLENIENENDKRQIMNRQSMNSRENTPKNRKENVDSSSLDSTKSVADVTFNFKENTKNRNENFIDLSVNNTKYVSENVTLNFKHTPMNTTEIIPKNRKENIKLYNLNRTESLPNVSLNSKEHTPENITEIISKNRKEYIDLYNNNITELLPNVTLYSKENLIDLPVSQSDSDIAEALTQVIEECSIENSSSEELSLDEEFISSVVKEINEELNTDLDGIILPPPAEFQD